MNHQVESGQKSIQAEPRQENNLNQDTDRRLDISERQSGTGGKEVHEQRSGDTGETQMKYMRVERVVRG